MLFLPCILTLVEGYNKLCLCILKLRKECNLLEMSVG